MSTRSLMTPTSHQRKNLVQNQRSRSRVLQLVFPSADHSTSNVLAHRSKAIKTRILFHRSPRLVRLPNHLLKTSPAQPITQPARQSLSDLCPTVHIYTIFNIPFSFHERSVPGSEGSVFTFLM